MMQYEFNSYYIFFVIYIMNKFTEMHNRIIFLKDKYNDGKTINDLTILDKYITEQERYYNSIPSSIKTENTLRYIIEKILFRIDQIEFKKNHITNVQNIIEYDTNNYDTNKYDDAVTMVYMKKSEITLKNFKKLDNLYEKLKVEHINTLNDLDDLTKKYTNLYNLLYKINKLI